MARSDPDDEDEDEASEREEEDEREDALLPVRLCAGTGRKNIRED